MDHITTKKKNVFRFSEDLMPINLEAYIAKRGPLNFKEFIPLFTDIVRGDYYFR